MRSSALVYCNLPERRISVSLAWYAAIARVSRSIRSAFDGFLSKCTFFIIRAEPSARATVPMPTLVAAAKKSANTLQAATESFAMNGAYERACEGLVRELVHHHDVTTGICQQEHQIVEPVLRSVASTPHAVTIAPVIVPAPTIMPPRNDVWPSDRVTDDCAAELDRRDAQRRAGR